MPEGRRTALVAGPKKRYIGATSKFSYDPYREWALRDPLFFITWIVGRGPSHLRARDLIHHLDTVYRRDVITL